MANDEQKQRILEKLEVLASFKQHTQTFEKLTDQIKEGSAKMDESQEIQKIKQNLKK